MKKELVIALEVLAIVVIVIVCSIQIKNTWLPDAKVLIEMSDFNNAWGFKYDGVIILTDGTIYDFSVKDRDSEKYFKLENLNQVSEFLLDHTTGKKRKLSDEDLNELKKLLSVEINPENYSSEYVGSDIGDTSISVYDYNKNQKIEIKSSGNYNTLNLGENIEAILEILDKYGIKVEHFKWSINI